MSVIGHRISAFKDVSNRIAGDAPQTRQHVHNLKAMVAGLGSKMEALNAMHSNPDPTVPKAANDRRVIKAAAKLAESRKQTFEDLQRGLRVGLADVQNRIDGKVNLKPNHFASEIRAHLRTLSPPDRLAACTQLAARNKGPELAAILEFDSVLTGISDEQTQRLRSLILDTHAKEEMHEQAELLEAFNTSLVCLDVAEKAAADLNDPAALAAIERGVEAAQKAATEFDAA